MKAVALISGGLDSSLAAAAVKGQGVEVVCVYFKIPFCPVKLQPAENFAEEFSRASGMKTLTMDLQDEFLEAVKHPRFGYGKNMNACIDCRILMLRRAYAVMKEQEASFLVTGEVLGQRPMSQFRKTMETIDAEAGVEGLVLRPLSAKLLSETLPEKNDWVKRQELYSFSGRSRSPQIDLAVMLGVIDYPQPAGGCLLTDPGFSRRLRDLLRHGTYDPNNVEMLKVGRHFRFTDNMKLVVGRNERENAVLESLARSGDVIFRPEGNTAGPTSILRSAVPSEAAPELIERSAAITASYCDSGGKPVNVEVFDAGKDSKRLITILPLSRKELPAWRL